MKSRELVHKLGHVERLGDAVRIEDRHPLALELQPLIYRANRSGHHQYRRSSRGRSAAVKVRGEHSRPARLR